MGWLGELTGWFGNAFTMFGNFWKTASNFLLSKLYLLIVPFAGLLKVVYDFCRSIIDELICRLSALGNGFGDGGTLTFHSSISFVNAYFPVDEILGSAIMLFTFFVGCQIIATIRGIKQTVLF